MTQTVKFRLDGDLDLDEINLRLEGRERTGLQFSSNGVSQDETENLVTFNKMPSGRPSTFVQIIIKGDEVPSGMNAFWEGDMLVENTKETVQACR